MDERFLTWTYDMLCKACPKYCVLNEPIVEMSDSDDSSASDTSDEDECVSDEDASCSDKSVDIKEGEQYYARLSGHTKDFSYFIDDVMCLAASPERRLMDDEAADEWMCTELSKKYTDLQMSIIKDHVHIALKSSAITYHYRVFNKHMGERFRYIVDAVLLRDYYAPEKLGTKDPSISGYRYLYTTSDGGHCIAREDEELSPIESTVTYAYSYKHKYDVIKNVFDDDEYISVSLPRQYSNTDVFLKDVLKCKGAPPQGYRVMKAPKSGDGPAIIIENADVTKLVTDSATNSIMNLKKANPVVAYNIHNEYHLRRCIAKASIPWCWCSQDILNVCSMYSSSVNAQQPQAANSADGVDSADITPEQTTSVGNQNIFTTGAGNVCGNKTDTRHVYMVHATIAKKHPGCTGEMWVMTNDAYIPDILEFVIVNEWFVIPVTPMGHTSPTQRKMVMEELGCSCVDSDDEDEDEDEDEDDEKPGSIKNDIRRHESRMYNAKQAVENEAKRRGKNAQQQNDQQTDEWESVKLALNAMLIRYTMSNPEVSRTSGVGVCSNVSYHKYAALKYCFKPEVCTTEEDAAAPPAKKRKKKDPYSQVPKSAVHCVHLDADASVMAFDARKRCNAILICLSTKIPKAKLGSTGAHRSAIVSAFKDGLLANLPPFVPGNVISPVRSLVPVMDTTKPNSPDTPITRSINNFTKREYKQIFHAITYEMESTYSVVQKLKSIHIPYTAMLCDVDFLLKVVLAKTDKQDMYRKRFMIVRRSHFILISTYSRRPRILWIGCAASCCQLSESDGVSAMQINVSVHEVTNEGINMVCETPVYDLNSSGESGHCDNEIIRNVCKMFTNISNTIPQMDCDDISPSTMSAAHFLADIKPPGLQVLNMSMSACSVAHVDRKAENVDRDADGSAEDKEKAALVRPHGAIYQLPSLIQSQTNECWCSKFKDEDSRVVDTIANGICVVLCCVGFNGA